MFLSRLRAYLLIDPLVILATAIMGTLSLAASAFDRTRPLWPSIVTRRC